MFADTLTRADELTDGPRDIVDSDVDGSTGVYYVIKTSLKFKQLRNLGHLPTLYHLMVS
jgi:hypothetical protein